MSTFGLFQVYGIEIETMLVDLRTLDVRPVAPQVLTDADGITRNTIEDGDITWSNELAAHVVEFKTTQPAPSLEDLHTAFHASMHRLQARLPDGIGLLPGAAHPWMDPDREFVRWTDDDAQIYEAFDRIFDCRGHGWSNLQSVHLNLPFRGDSEFSRLHEAIRLVLPLIPALSAASPVLGGRIEPELDVRLRYYATNARRIPQMTGRVIPDSIADAADYERKILAPLYAALEPHDPDRILREEWANALGAIARFDRSAIEIRIIDAQECPRMDLTVAAAVTALVRAFAEGQADCSIDGDPESTEHLADLLQRTVHDGEDAIIEGPRYLARLGLDPSPRSARSVWAAKLDALGLLGGPWSSDLGHLLNEGPLARRLLRALPAEPDREALTRTWRLLADCLTHNAPFHEPG